MIDQATANDIQQRLDQHNKARDNKFPGQCSFTQEEMATLPPRPSNDEVGQLELFEWTNTPPERYFAYVKETDKRPTEVVIWTGLKIGRITSYGPIKDCYTPSGGWYQKRYIHVRGTNGNDYCGWYHCSNGTYCRLRMTAESKRQRTKAA